MDRRLLWVGMMSMLVTLALWVADAVAWIPRSMDDRWSRLTLKAGLVALAGALLLRLLAPVATFRRRGRCAVCGQSTERGHVYCLDHLQETVNATRDQSHSQAAARPRTAR